MKKVGKTLIEEQERLVQSYQNDIKDKVLEINALAEEIEDLKTQVRDLQNEINIRMDFIKDLRNIEEE